jgi:exodeoxyribonuclease V alpha subunit
MKSALESSTQAVLAGLVERVTFHNAENGFCVIRAKARGHRDLVTVVGHAAIISAGEWITASGEWINDRAHGQQFKARFLKTSAPSSIDGIEKYLGSGMIRGIGPVYAKKMVKAFGEKVFDVIEAEPDRLREVTGIGAVRAKRITDAWAEQKIVREIMVFLHSNGVGTARAVRIFKTYGADAVQVMIENPLSACPRHPRHRFQERRRDRDEARHRKDRDDPVARRNILRADRGDGRGSLRTADGSIDPAR